MSDHHHQRPRLPGDGGRAGGWFARPLHRFVAKTVAVTLLAGAAFHLAMDHALATRPNNNDNNNTTNSESGREPSSSLSSAPWDDGGSDDRAGRRRAVTGGGAVANQNAAFRRFLVELDGKDARTKLEEAAKGMDYFMRPQALDEDVKLRRIRRPTDDRAGPSSPPSPSSS